MAFARFKMIAGLGNPGQTYARTRHNIGFMVVQSIAEEAGIDFNKTRFDAAFSKVTLHGHPVFLVKPLSFMNRSGFPLQKLSAYYQIAVTDIIVVHDDMDLDFGVLKIVQNRGPGGHNGIKSIVDTFGDKNFIRVRVGVGHPDDHSRVTGHVLGGFSPQEQERLGDVVKEAAAACSCILSQGVVRAMNQVNSRG
jgi:peptidyl-tRNA hydrolase, PTH1 family